MGAPAIPRPDFGGAPSVEKSAPPFGAIEKPRETIVLHVKILSPDPAERLSAARVLQQSLAEQRVGAKGLSVLITDEAVTVELSSTTAVASKIAADVMKILGMSR